MVIANSIYTVKVSKRIYKPNIILIILEAHSKNEGNNFILLGVAAKEGLTKTTSGSPANYCSQLFLFLHVD